MEKIEIGDQVCFSHSHAEWDDEHQEWFVPDELKGIVTAFDDSESQDRVVIFLDEDSLAHRVYERVLRKICRSSL